MSQAETAQHQSYQHPTMAAPWKQRQSLNDPVTTDYSNPPSKRHQQQPTKPNGNHYQNTNLHPMELCAFCSCRQQQQPNR